MSLKVEKKSQHKNEDCGRILINLRPGALRGTRTHTLYSPAATTGEGRRLQRASERPPGVTYSLFTNRGRRAASARCAQPFLCRRDVSGSDERGHLCGWTSLFTPRLSLHFTAPHPRTQTKCCRFFLSHLDNMIPFVRKSVGQ